MTSVRMMKLKELSHLLKKSSPLLLHSASIYDKMMLTKVVTGSAGETLSVYLVIDFNAKDGYD